MGIDIKTYYLTRDLDRAFATVPRPDEDQLLMWNSPAGHALCDDLAGRPPAAVPSEVVSRHYDGLSLLAGPARKYYLPAYARAAVRQPDPDVAEFLLYALGGDVGWQLKSPFTDRQRTAVVTLLDYLPRCLDPVFAGMIAEARTRWQNVVSIMAHAA